MADWNVGWGVLRSRLSRRAFLGTVGAAAAGAAVAGPAARDVARADPGGADEEAGSDDRSCGGSRSGLCTWYDVGSGRHFRVKLAGSALADVFAVSPAELRAIWRSTCLTGTVPGTGTAILTAQRHRESEVIIVSDQKSAEPFFPAMATHHLYFTITVFKGGKQAGSWTNTAPMMMRARISDVPPYGTSFRLTEDATFYDTTVSPARPRVILREGSTGLVTDPGGLTITFHDVVIDHTAGRFSFTAVTGPSAHRTPPKSLNWFVTGYGAATITSGAFALRTRGSRVRIPVTGHFSPSTAASGVVVNTFSGTKWEAHKALTLTP